MIDPQQASSSPFAPVSAEFPDQFYQDPYGVDRYVIQEKVLLQWQAQHSFFYRSSRRSLNFLIMSAVLVGIIFLVMQEFFLVGVVAAAMFVVILLSQLPPEPQLCQITTLGLKRGTQYVYWGQLTQFWIEPIQGQYFLYLRQVFPFYQKIKLNVTGQDLNQFQKTIGTYLLYKKPQQNWLEMMLEKVIYQLPFNLNW
jgi:hypothetical protein